MRPYGHFTNARIYDADSDFVSFLDFVTHSPTKDSLATLPPTNFYTIKIAVQNIYNTNIFSNENF